VVLLGPPGNARRQAVTALLSRYGLTPEPVADGSPVPGSYWGAPEAGLVGATVHVRRDTPVHSVLHECCHFICMDPVRRGALNTDAGGSSLEECAVCYLSIVLAGELPSFGRSRMLEDMDAWGYSFRLGCAQAWFEEDADDARSWLTAMGLLDAAGQSTWRVRGRHEPSR